MIAPGSAPLDRGGSYPHQDPRDSMWLLGSTCNQPASFCRIIWSRRIRIWIWIGLAAGNCPMMSWCCLCILIRWCPSLCLMRGCLFSIRVALKSPIFCILKPRHVFRVSLSFFPSCITLPFLTLSSSRMLAFPARPCIRWYCLLIVKWYSLVFWPWWQPSKIYSNAC